MTGIAFHCVSLLRLCVFVLGLYVFCTCLPFFWFTVYVYFDSMRDAFTRSGLLVVIVQCVFMSGALQLLTLSLIALV